MENTETRDHSGSTGGLDGSIEPIVKLPFSIKDRTLVMKRASTIDTSTFHLEEVRDYLKKLQELQDPVDYAWRLDKLCVEFTGGTMRCRFLRHNGISPIELLVTDVGAGQMSRMVLPSRFFSGLRQLVRMDREGEELAARVWGKFSLTKPKMRMLRTLNMQVSGQVRRVIRSCHSQGYAPYSNLEFVQTMLDHAGNYSELPVLSWWVTDSVMRLRFAAIDTSLAVLRHWDAGSLGGEPIPMIECWNSEVGLRKVVLRGGMFKIGSGGAVPHWDERREWNWIHRGNSERIQKGVRVAFRDLTIAAEHVVAAYRDATTVQINDALSWLLTEMGRAKVSNRAIASAKAGLDHPTTTPGGMLASVVDAISLTAAQETDIFQQYELERLAARVLKRGLDEARKNNNTIDGRV